MPVQFIKLHKERAVTVTIDFLTRRANVSLFHFNQTTVLTEDPKTPVKEILTPRGPPSVAGSQLTF